MFKVTPALGTDPEFSLIDTRAKRITSAVDIIPGTKNAPHKVDGGAIQVDGCMIEYNTDPAFTAEEFVENNLRVMKELRNFIPSKYSFNFKPSVRFDEYYFDSVPDDAKELGCTPDFNAWENGKQNPPPSPPPGYETLRTCSGHLHLSWTKDEDIHSKSHMWDCCTVVKALESYIFPFIKLWDTDNTRAMLYGKPGAFRPKPYGVEWRTPSNAWLNHPKLWPWLFDSCMAVLKAVDAGTAKISSAGCNTAPINSSEIIPPFPLEPPTPKKRREKKEIAYGVRVAATSSRVTYDLDLDLNNGANYTSPSGLIHTEVFIPA